MKIENPYKSLTVLAENAKHSPLPINKITTPESQLWIFSNQLQSEIYLTCNYDIVVCDRTVVDAIAYSRYAGFNKLADSLIKVAKFHINSYNKIIFKTYKNNDYFYSDGVRAAGDDEFRKSVSDILYDTYQYLLKSTDCEFTFEEI